MSKWSLILFVLMVGSLGVIHSAQITASNQQNPAAAREPSIYVGEEPAKKVFKRDLSDDDDFSIDDESSLQNASAEASPLPAGDHLKPAENAVSEGDSNDQDYSLDELTAEDKNSSTGNELDYGNNSDDANTTPENVKAVSGEITEKGESFTIEKTDVSAASEGDAEEPEDISSENMAVDILPGNGAVNSDSLGKLMANDDGSGDGDLDSESEEIIPTGKMIPVSSENSDNKADETDIGDIKSIASNTTEKTDTAAFSIDEISEESIDPPDEIPIPNPPTKEEDSTAKDFQEEELIPVSTSVAPSGKDSSSGGSKAADTLPVVDPEGSGEGRDEGHVDMDSEETEETTTEKTHVPAGRNFQPTAAIDTTEPPPPTDAIPQNADDTGNPTLMKGVLPSGNKDANEGINEIGVKKEDPTPAADPTDESPASSSGSFIVLGAIMVTIVVLLAYTVIKSRRQKKARRSGNITKAAEEDQGREMKEVDKLLVPRTNGFSPPNGGSKDDETLPLNSFKRDFDELLPVKNGYLPENGVGGLTDVIVENVPRLNTAPNMYGTEANEKQSEGEDDQDSWVQSPDKALESTKIKMYIDEDSIPKTPIVIVNRGPAPN